MPDINKPINLTEKDLVKRRDEIEPVNISDSLNHDQVSRSESGLETY